MGGMSSSEPDMTGKVRDDGQISAEPLFGRMLGLNRTATEIARDVAFNDGRRDDYERLSGQAKAEKAAAGMDDTMAQTAARESARESASRASRAAAGGGTPRSSASSLLDVNPNAVRSRLDAFTLGAPLGRRSLLDVSSPQRGLFATTLSAGTDNATRIGLSKSGSVTFTDKAEDIDPAPETTPAHSAATQQTQDASTKQQVQDALEMQASQRQKQTQAARSYLGTLAEAAKADPRSELQRAERSTFAGRYDTTGMKTGSESAQESKRNEIAAATLASDPRTRAMAARMLGWDPNKVEATYGALTFGDPLASRSLLAGMGPAGSKSAAPATKKSLSFGQSVVSRLLERERAKIDNARDRARRAAVAGTLAADPRVRSMAARMLGWAPDAIDWSDRSFAYGEPAMPQSVSTDTPAVDGTLARSLSIPEKIDAIKRGILPQDLKQRVERFVRSGNPWAQVAADSFMQQLGKLSPSALAQIDADVLEWFEEREWTRDWPSRQTENFWNLPAYQRENLARYLNAISKSSSRPNIAVELMSRLVDKEPDAAVKLNTEIQNWLPKSKK